MPRLKTCQLCGDWITGHACDTATTCRWCTTRKIRKPDTSSLVFRVRGYRTEASQTIVVTTGHITEQAAINFMQTMRQKDALENLRIERHIQGEYWICGDQASCVIEPGSDDERERAQYAGNQPVGVC